MRFALIEGKLIEAALKLKAVCPGCSQPVIARCGTQRIHHWAHQNNKNCDNWWEPETEWHRLWKNNFPKEWQEIFLPDQQTGEKHIADIRTSHGLVIEFQHSHINPVERVSRERFYKNMVWVVDGTRLKNDYKRFVKNKGHTFNKGQGINLAPWPEWSFPAAWLESLVPVIFDFRGTETITNISDSRNSLFCLFPSRIGSDSIFVEMSFEFFIKSAINDDWRIFIESINKFRQVLQTERNRQQMQEQNVAFESLRRSMQYRYRRGRRF